MQIEVIERAQNIQVQEQEIIRRERELDATIRKPAEAEKYRLEKLAEANRYDLHYLFSPAFTPCFAECSIIFYIFLRNDFTQ